MAESILSKLANLDTCSIALRREFLHQHDQHNPRPKPLDKIQTTSDYPALFANIYKHSNGIIFGEQHFNAATINFLAQNIKHLAQLGVETLFFEGMYFGLEKGKDGDRNLKDSTHLEYAPIIEAAQYNNINIVGIDAAGCKRGEGITRDIFMNIYSQAIINNMQDKGKWIALVGMMHLNDSKYINPISFEQHPVRGLSELTGSISIALDNCGRNYIKRKQDHYGTPTKKISSDFIIGIDNDNDTSPNIDNPVLKLAQEIDARITYYDIDSFAQQCSEGNYVTALVFALQFKDFEQRDLEPLKFAILADIAIKDNQWLKINIDGLDMIFSCNYDVATKVTQNIKTTLQNA